MKRLSTAPPAKKSSGLLLVMWAIGFMSITITGLFHFVMIGLEATVTDGADFRARQLAESGVAIGSHPGISPGDPLLSQKISPTESFDVEITDETARLNINFLLFAQRTDILENLFRIWGLRTNEANTIIDCLADWVDDNSVKRLNGAEKEYYETVGLPGLPPNRPFESLDELELVKNWDLIIQAEPSWRDYFTLLGEGRVNINDARREIVQAVLGCAPEQADAIIKQRNGKDGVQHTDDDTPISDINQLRFLANLNERQILAAQPIVSFTGNIRRVSSTGKVGDYVKKIEVVMRTPSAPLRYFEWREF